MPIKNNIPPKILPKYSTPGKILEIPFQSYDYDKRDIAYGGTIEQKPADEQHRWEYNIYLQFKKNIYFRLKYKARNYYNDRVNLDDEFKYIELHTSKQNLIKSHKVIKSFNFYTIIKSLGINIKTRTLTENEIYKIVKEEKPKERFEYFLMKNDTTKQGILEKNPELEDISGIRIKYIPNVDHYIAEMFPLLQTKKVNINDRIWLPLL